MMMVSPTFRRHSTTPSRPSSADRARVQHAQADDSETLAGSVERTQDGWRAGGRVHKGPALAAPNPRSPSIPRRIFPRDPRGAHSSGPALGVASLAREGETLGVGVGVATRAGGSRRSPRSGRSSSGVIGVVRGSTSRGRRFADSIARAYRPERVSVTPGVTIGSHIIHAWGTFVVVWFGLCWSVPIAVRIRELPIGPGAGVRTVDAAGSDEARHNNETSSSGTSTPTCAAAVLGPRPPSSGEVRRLSAPVVVLRLAVACETLPGVQGRLSESALRPGREQTSRAKGERDGYRKRGCSAGRP